MAGRKAQCICSKWPSKGWIYSFLRRWPEIKLGKPSGLDPKRAQAFNRPVVDRCFEKLDNLVMRYKVAKKDMYNMDEKGCQRGGGRKASSRKYFVPRARRPKYKQRSANLELVTIIECICADGTSLLPGFVFQGKEFSPEWFDVDDGINVSMSENGWTDDFLCSEWFIHSFIPQAKARNTAGTPILLIYDGHGSHDNLKIIDLAISHGIILFCLPPHTTHMLQPLDVGVFGPFSRAWADRCDEIVEETDEEMPREDFVKEYMKVRSTTFKEATIQQAFKKSGCYPVDASVFTDKDFAPSISTSTSARHVPSSYPTTPETYDDIYATEDEDETEEIPSQADNEQDSSDSDNEESDHDSPCTTISPDQNENNTNTSVPSIHDPFGFLKNSQQSMAPVSKPLPSTPVPPESFYAHMSSSNTSRKPENTRPPRKTLIEELQERVKQLEGEAITMRTHLSLAEDNIKELKRKQNARENKSRKRPKLNVEARNLTSLDGRNLAAAKEAAKEAEKQKKDAARDQREADAEARQRIRLTRDPNHAFSGTLGSKSKPDLIDVAHALGIRKVTQGKEKLTKKQIQDLIDTYFDSNPEKREDPRFEGLFNTRRRPRPQESTENNAGPSTGQQLTNLYPRTGPPLSANIANTILPPSPLFPIQYQFPHIVYPPGSFPPQPSLSIPYPPYNQSDHR